MISSQPVRRKRIPYGMSNYASVRRDNCYFVDKTAFIPELEAANKFFFFIRPRRFGKSLTLSMLKHYYDINKADDFEKLFGGLYIGDHPTEERNSYLIIELDFSVIDGSLGNYKGSMDAHCSIHFESFCDIYKPLLPEGIKERLILRNGAVEQLQLLIDECSKVGRKIFLFIDEYDHFTNDILSDATRLKDYESETHGEGYFRKFFNTIKAGTKSVIERCFVTGVSPVTMDDVTSGFNIGTNYSMSPEFNSFMGFTEEDVRQMLDYYRTTCEFHHTTDELIEGMKPWYDNYCFAQKSYGRTTMYNSCMVLYFVDNYIRNGGDYPDYMLEDNIRTDYNKLRMLVRRDSEFGHDASVIRRIAEQGYITAELKTGFPARSITDPRNFVSLLYYFGMLSIDGTIEGETKLIIPNQVVREQLYGYLLETYEKEELSQKDYIRSKLSSRLAYRGEWKEYFGYIAECLHNYASQRDKQKGEPFVHGFTLAMTSLNRFYRAISEQDCPTGYVDLFLRPELDIYKDMLHSYIVEFKYVKSSEPDSQVEAKRQEAIGQANRYAETELVKSSVGHTTLHKIVMVYKGMEMVVCEEV
ncbi:MAG: AAA family ATPase [Bacteroidaceae bacterium]|nr:AAA family ATPase [Bacteroidaceae bacterium]